jgi:hypothetical protein
MTTTGYIVFFCAMSAGAPAIESTTLARTETRRALGI